MQSQNKYSPGLHILLTLEVKKTNLLVELDSFLSYTNLLLQKHDLKVVGTSSFQFDSKGFTSAICLMESHLCIHTWPEFNQLTLDVYLCNYIKDNTQKVIDISEDLKSFFEATVLSETKVNR